MNRDAVSTAEQILATAVRQRVFPAAVAEVGDSGGVLWQRAFGQLTFDGDSPAASVRTIFDLASLTKPMATASVALALESRGDLPLDLRVAECLPDWVGADRDTATIRHLMEHASGLSARLIDRPPRDARAFEHDICAMPLEYRPGSRSIYSDLGFILLGFCCERRGGTSLAAQTETILNPVGREDEEGSALLTRVPAGLRSRTAPTLPLAEDDRRGRRLVGEVHDNYACALGGYAGHAGLFGTAPAVGRFAKTVLRAARGSADEPPPFTPSIVRRAVARGPTPGSSRALGWDTMLPTSSCGTHLSASAFGHVGFTGTSLWVDPERDRYFVLLTNRACGDGTSDEMQQVRRAFHEALATL